MILEALQSLTLKPQEENCGSMLQKLKWARPLAGSHGLRMLLAAPCQSVLPSHRGPAVWTRSPGFFSGLAAKGSLRPPAPSIRGTLTSLLWRHAHLIFGSVGWLRDGVTTAGSQVGGLPGVKAEQRCLGAAYKLS